MCYICCSVYSIGPYSLLWDMFVNMPWVWKKEKRGSHLERTWLLNWSPDDKRKSSNIAGQHFRTWFNFSTWSTSKCNQVKISVHNMHAKSWAIISSDYNTIEPFRLPEYITISEMSKNFFLFILWTLWEVLDPLVTKI